MLVFESADLTVNLCRFIWLCVRSQIKPLFSEVDLFAPNGNLFSFFFSLQEVGYSCFRKNFLKLLLTQKYILISSRKSSPSFFFSSLPILDLYISSFSDFPFMTLPFLSSLLKKCPYTSVFLSFQASIIIFSPASIRNELLTTPLTVF